MGVAKVLSTIKGTPCLCAMRANFSMSSTSMLGLEMVSPNNALVFGRKAWSISSSDALASMKVHSMPSFFQRNAEQVECTSVDGRRAYEVVACLTDIENGIEVGSLAGRGQHSTHTTFQCCDFCGDGVIGGVLQACIEISRIFQIEQTRHLFAGVILDVVL